MKRLNLYLIVSVIFVLMLIPVCLAGVTPTTKITKNVTKVNLSAKNITSVNLSAKNTSANVSGPVYNANIMNLGQPPASFVLGSINLQPAISTGVSGSENSIVKARADSTDGETGPASPPASNVNPGPSGWGTTNTGLGSTSGWGTTGSTNTNTGQNNFQIPSGGNIPIIVSDPAEPNIPALTSGSPITVCFAVALATTCKNNNYNGEGCEIYKSCNNDGSGCQAIQDCINGPCDPTSPACMEVIDPCFYYKPGGSGSPTDACVVYCNIYPKDKANNCPEVLDPCGSYPGSPACCKKNPKDSSCKQINSPCSDPTSKSCVEYCMTSYGLVDWPTCTGVIDYCKDSNSKLCNDYCESNYQDKTCQVQCVKDPNSPTCVSYCTVVQKQDQACKNACIKDPNSETCSWYCKSQGGVNDPICKTAGQDSDPCKDPKSQACTDFCNTNPSNIKCQLAPKDSPVKSNATPTAGIASISGLPSFSPGDFGAIFPGVKVSSGSISGGSSGSGTLTTALPDLIITKIEGPVLAKSDSSIIVPFTVKNQGKGKAGAFFVGFFVTTPTVSLEGNVPVAGLNAGASYDGKATLKIPGTLSGYYYLGAYADIKNTVKESDENNNYYVRVNQIGIA